MPGQFKRPPSANKGREDAERRVYKETARADLLAKRVEQTMQKVPLHQFAHTIVGLRSDDQHVPCDHNQVYAGLCHSAYPNVVAVMSKIIDLNMHAQIPHMV